MRRMILPEVKIKSKLKDDVYSIGLEELFTHSYQQTPNTKTLIIQTVSQSAGDIANDDGGINITDFGDISIEITNATLTITSRADLQHIYINGFGIDEKIDLSELPYIDIYSPQRFDVYIIKP